VSIGLHLWQFSSHFSAEANRRKSCRENKKSEDILEGSNQCVKVSKILIPFPMLSMMLCSGHPDASAAALWITRRKNRPPM
jgi:hypothetical protein